MATALALLPRFPNEEPSEYNLNQFKGVVSHWEVAFSSFKSAKTSPASSAVLLHSGNIESTQPNPFLQWQTPVRSGKFNGLIKDEK
ncbi:hypothetical protein V6N13_117435 [Hibiscus sabdariffa]|uniref:Uncharacterized protein n=1 Tax=Hibiscus sabdariffa TaxID=183260 RepID=A0ABR2PAJ3_9ROSI